VTVFFIAEDGSKAEDMLIEETKIIKLKNILKNLIKR
jgi:hypothetical protein